MGEDADACHEFVFKNIDIDKISVIKDSLTNPTKNERDLESNPYSFREKNIFVQFLHVFIHLLSPIIITSSLLFNPLQILIFPIVICSVILLFAV